MVDEKTADATVGSDLQISTEQSMNSTELISLVNEFTQNGVNPLATSVPEITLADEEGGDNLQTFVLFDGNEEVLRWSEQSIPGDDVDAAMRGYRNNGFSAGQDSAYTLDLPGSDRGGKENRLDDVLLKPNDEQSENITFVWEEIEFNFTSGGTNLSDVPALFEAYKLRMEGDWSGLDLFVRISTNVI